MTDDDLVMGLVERVLETPTESREQFTWQVCEGDAPLFEKVWHYVKWDERMKGFLLDPLLVLADEPTLQPGQMLQNRFRIVRKVAAGGMGIVYEAQDEKLDRRIAIKCAKAGYNARLSPEVRHASEINHLNVCKTWDIHTASGASGDFDFLTMEFIEGQTLAERLRQGPPPRKEAQSIAKQICAGLSEAHRQQVIHGDLKSSNVLLSPVPTGVRVAITDFGLARSWVAQGVDLAAGGVGGTRDYMAPELFTGGAPSFASDIYAVGILLHEIAAGKRPFSAATPVIEKVQRRPAPLDHPWGQTISRCLEPEPARRWVSVARIGEALMPFPWLRWSAIAAAVVLGIAGGALGFRGGNVPRESIRLAIVPFTTDAGSKSLTDGIVNDTASRLRNVKDSRRKLTIDVLRESFQNRSVPPEKTAAPAGVTHTFTGNLHYADRRVSIHAVLTDARTHFLLKEWDAEYQPGELGNIPIALAGLVTGTLRLPPLTNAATVNAAAYADFTEGVGLLRQDKLDAALPLLTRAVALDPASPLTHARLAEAQARKYPQSMEPTWLAHAKESLRKAEQRNPDLALVWVVSGRINEYQGLYEASESDLKRALEIDPNDGDAWRRLGRVYKQNNGFASSVVAFQKAIEVQPYDWLNHRDLCAVNTEQAKYDDAVSQCRTVVQLAPDLSDAHVALAVALFCQGKFAEADAEFKSAIQLNPKSVFAIFSRAFALTSRGLPREAIPLFYKAIEIGPATHLIYSDLGTAYRLLGAAAMARKSYKTAMNLAETELARNPRNSILKAQLAYVCAQLGEDRRANSELMQARHLAPDSVEVSWWAVLTWDALKQRPQAIASLERMPDASIRRLSRDADVAELRHSARFQELAASRHIER